MLRLLIKFKWRYLRRLVKRRRISLHKCLERMHQIQMLEKLEGYSREKLYKYSYKKIRKLFIKEFPNEYLHDPYTF